MIIPFPRPFRRPPEVPRRPHRWREATRARLKVIVTRALEILDSLDGHPSPEEPAQPRIRRRRKASNTGA